MMPVTTYRLQLHKGFTLTDARQIAPYLSNLGVTDLYCSPIFTARPGSTHGYDVCSHTEINPELGGELQYEALEETLRSLGMGLILDFVPNHMSNDPRTNAWWRDVLENGPSSPFASFFDVDWDPVKPELKDRLLLPILAEPYGEALESGALRVRFDEGALNLEYRDYVLPINPRRMPLVLEHDLAALQAVLGETDPRLREFLSILTALRNLPPYTERDSEKIIERQREKLVARERLHALVQSCPPVRAHIDAALAAFNGTPGDRASFDRLHELLELQAYRLASWRTASDEINYRRFFDINELAGLRVEDPAVFGQIHSLLLRLVGRGIVTGVRIDHIDGLFDPTGYLERLQAALRAASPTEASGGDPGGVYVAVEKILSSGEALRGDWPVAGTTGYNFLNDLNGVFIDARGKTLLQRTYARVCGRRDLFLDVVYDSKRLIVITALSSEFQVLAQAVNRLSERDRLSRDFTLGSIRRALREVVACFPVYRTYVSQSGATASDREVVDAALRAARRRNPAMEWSIFDFLRRVLLPVGESRSVESPEAEEQSRLEVAMRFQQYTAPVQAKGVEDTAFYRYHLLTSLNEVGGDPGRFGVSVEAFHAANAARRARWPKEMLATTTHDTKRAEDARARLNVLSEITEEWRKSVSRWIRINRGSRARLSGGGLGPDGNDEYLFYQTLIGAWPAEREDTPTVEAASHEFAARIAAYMSKAIKEAKTHTSWITENREYEQAVAAFVQRTLLGAGAAAFLPSFVPFARRVARLGVVNSLAQTTLKIVSPGVPDFYQGTELWDLSLVDPDNRRPVDFESRRAWLEELDPLLARVAVDAVGTVDDGELAKGVAAMLNRWPDGRIKLYLTACGLRLRRHCPALFLEGEYLPLQSEGLHGGHLVACARRHGGDVVLAIVPRLTAGLSPAQDRLPIGSDVWADTRVRLPAELAQRRFRHLLTGERITPSEIKGGGGWVLASRALQSCPVALLWADPV